MRHRQIETAYQAQAKLLFQQCMQLIGFHRFAQDIVRTGGYPGELRRMLGIWAEEIDALFPDQKNRIVMTKP